MAESDNPTVGCWVMTDESLRDALTRAAAGEAVDVVLLELYANSDVRPIDAEDEDGD